MLYRQVLKQSPGFALPMAMILGLLMLTLMTALLIEVQSQRNSSQTRQELGGSAIVTDSALARVLVELSKPENGRLLARNYDPIDPKTGRNYLGPDGVVNSDDEKRTAVDQWTTYDPSAFPCYQLENFPAPNVNFLSGTIGEKGSYKILAYRYNARSQEGTVLVEGAYLGQTAHMQVTIDVRPIVTDAFPGIALIKPYSDVKAGILALRGREILGKNGNVYTIPESSADPSLTGRSDPGDPSRKAYLNSVWSSTELDGAPIEPGSITPDNPDGIFKDTISGSILACNPNIKIPKGITGTNFRVIDSSRTLYGVGGTVPTLYRLESIKLSGSDVLKIDTTDGPVVIEMLNLNQPGQRFSLRDTSKILNVREDGQPPRVGDVRFIIRFDMSVDLHDQACMSQVFLYSAQDELLLLTDGPGCPSGKKYKL